MEMPLALGAFVAMVLTVMVLAFGAGYWAHYLLCDGVQSKQAIASVLRVHELGDRVKGTVYSQLEMPQANERLTYAVGNPFVHDYFRELLELKEWRDHWRNAPNKLPYVRKRFEKLYHKRLAKFHEPNSAYLKFGSYEVSVGGRHPISPSLIYPLKRE